MVAIGHFEVFSQDLSSAAPGQGISHPLDGQEECKPYRDFGIASTSTIPPRNLQVEECRK